jgi:hypothetical protein
MTGRESDRDHDIGSHPRRGQIAGNCPNRRRNTYDDGGNGVSDEGGVEQDVGDVSGNEEEEEEDEDEDEDDS